MLGMRRLILLLLLNMLLMQVIRQPTAPANNDYRRAGEAIATPFLGFLLGAGEPTGAGATADSATGIACVPSSAAPHPTQNRASSASSAPQ